MELRHERGENPLWRALLIDLYREWREREKGQLDRSTGELEEEHNSTPGEAREESCGIRETDDRGEKKVRLQVQKDKIET